MAAKRIRKVTPVGDISWYVKWVSVVFILLSGISGATGFIPENFYFACVGCLGWTAVGMLWHDRALIVLNSVMAILAFIAIINN